MNLSLRIPQTFGFRGTNWGTTLAKLTVRRIETAKGPAKLTDEHGLYLRVSPRGAMSWIQRLNIQGLRTDNAIGHYPSISLAEARTTAFERWKIAKAGGDPCREDGKGLLAPSFADAAEAVIAIHEPTWRSPKSGPQWRPSLQTYAYPSIGQLPVSAITPGHVKAVLLPIWTDKRETARRVKQRISAICRWAVAQGYRTDDPAGIVVDAALPRNAVKRRPMRALPYEEVAHCIDKVKASRRASASSKLALEFLVLTGARSAEVRKATWDEIDVEGAMWTVPAERMKANREHRVPLSRRALDVLAEAAGHRVAAFQGFADQAVRRLTLLANVKELGDLAALPGNRLVSPRGERAGQYSIRINAQWRICFRWEPDGPCDVEIVDYRD